MSAFSRLALSKSQVQITEDVESATAMKVSGSVGPRPKKRAKRFTFLPLNVLLGSLGVFIFFLLVGMASKKRRNNTSKVASSGKVDTDTGRPSLYTYKVVAEYPHDGEAFTQGFEYDSQCDGKGVCRDIFWESTGLNGHSTVREVDVKSGDVLRTASLDKKDFGEGLTRLGDHLYQLTWQSPKMLVYEVGNFDSIQTKHTSLKDGWGITNDGTNLIVGDSTHTLYYIDPKSMKTQRKIDVTDEGREITWLNELEWVDGLIYANIWQRDCIAQIEPSTGHVVGWVDVSGLKTAMLKGLDPKSSRVDVLNGIAWNQKEGKLYVTGKLWPKIYEIELRPLYDDSKSTDVAKLTDEIRKQCIGVTSWVLCVSRRILARTRPSADCSDKACQSLVPRTVRGIESKQARAGMVDGGEGLNVDSSSLVLENMANVDRNNEELLDPCASMLYISNLGARITANEIIQYFATHKLGRVVSIEVGQVHGVSQYCLCSLESPEQAKQAVEVLHGLSTLGSSGLFVKHVGKELRAVEEAICMGGGGNPCNGMLDNLPADAALQDDTDSQDGVGTPVINYCDGVKSVTEAVETLQIREEKTASFPAAASGVDDENADGNAERNGGFTTLYLINLGMEITEEDLYNDFSAYGKVVATKVLRKDGAFHKALSGFIEFSLHVEAKRTKDILTGNRYRGSLVYPRWATRSLQKCLMKQQRNGGKIWSPVSAAKNSRLNEKKDVVEETNPFDLYNKNGGNRDRRIELFATRKVDSMHVNESQHGWRIPSSYSMPGTFVPAAVESMHLYQHPQTPVYMGYQQMGEYQANLHRMSYFPAQTDSSSVHQGLVYGPGYCLINPRAYPSGDPVMDQGMYHHHYGYDSAYTKQTRRHHSRSKKKNAPRRQQE